MNLIKTTKYTLFSNIIRLISSVVINKVIAIFIGPAGLAVIGNFNNFLGITRSFSNGGINNGVVTLLAESKDEGNKIYTLNSALFLTFLFSFFFAILIFIFSEKLAIFIFRSTNYNFVFDIYSFTIIFFAFNSLVLSTLNGEKEIKKLTFVNIFTSIYSLLFTSIIIIFYKLNGALIAMVLNQSVTFFFSYLVLKRISWFKIKKLNIWENTNVKKLLKFSLMALISAIIVPGTEFIIRKIISSSISITSAGYWQGIWSMSTMGINLITSAITIYYLPVFSENRNKLNIRKEILTGFGTIIPAAIIAFILIYIFRIQIIKLLFSNKFLEMESLFLWQGIGAILKIASFILGLLIIAKAEIKIYIFLELLFSVSYIVFTKLILSTTTLVGVTYSYALANLITLIFLLIILRDYFLIKRNVA